MFDTILGLPVHPLAVHATVVVVPAAALSVGLAALWPRFRTWAGPLPLLLSLTALGLVPLTVRSGESLTRRVEATALLDRHRALGEGLLVWVVLLAVAAAALLWVRSRDGRSSRGEAVATPRLVMVGVILVALSGMAGTTVQVVRIGHSGAAAVWSNVTDAARG